MRLLRAALSFETGSAAGLLQSERRWKFSHDTFEEYFAASRLVTVIDQTNQWPDLSAWVGKERDFQEVIGFFAEMADAKMLAAVLSMNLPAAWKERLTLARNAGAPSGR